MRRRPVAFAARFLTCLAFLTLVAACGGGGGDAPPPSDAPPVQQPPAVPTAAFTAAASGTVQSPIAFDASASKSADGSALQYVWDFGDGVRGGGAKIAHAFAAAGTRSVTLTVIDGAGRQDKVTRGVEVTAAATGAGSVIVHAAIVDSAGAALPGVAIGTPGGTTPIATTDGMGLADITLDRGPTIVLRLTKPGYADQTQAVQLPATVGAGTRITAFMRPRDAAQTLADAHAGGSLVGRAGATITLPADALVNAAGAVVTGPVAISMTTVDPTSHGAGGFPGRFDGVTPDGATSPIASFGAVEFVLGDAGNRLQLAPGKTATIELPLAANRRLDGTAVVVGDVIPLWSLDETTGAWIQEGTGTIVANAGSSTGLAMRAVVSHFSWWNCDMLFDPYDPMPDCPPDLESFNQLPLEEREKWYGGPGDCEVFTDIAPYNPYGGAGPDDGPDGHQRAAAVARSRATSTPTQSFVAGYSRSTIVPITGGVAVPVPADNDVYVTGFALNGTWAGQVVVHGAVGAHDKVSIPMRPIALALPTVEALTLPALNLARATAAGQASARFSFTVGELQDVALKVGAAPGSSLRGTARVLLGTTVLASASFDGATTAALSLRAPATGTYILEVTPEQPGAFAITGFLLGGVQSETLAFPASAARSLDAYGGWRAGFDLSAATSVHLAFKLDYTDAAPLGELQLAAPDGSILWRRSNVGILNGETADLALPAGHYTFSYSRTDDRATTFQFSSEAVDWAPVADPLPVADSNAVTDLVTDRQGRPVVGVMTHPVINQIASSSIQLRRFTGTGWEDVGGPIAASPFTCGYHTTSIAFDSANTPTVAYATHGAGDVYTTSVRHLVAGAWLPVGANDGVLPGSADACDDTRSPRVVIDPADHPVVAYKGNAAIVVRRFDGTDWNKLAAGAQDAFAVNYSGHDLAIDATGTVWFALRGGDSSDNTVVRRFDVPSGQWQTVGPNHGVLPETNTNGFSLMRLGFDAAGRPVVGGAISVFSQDRASTSGGTAVYRFDGTTWTTSGGYQLPGSSLNNTLMPGFAMLGNDALMSWTNSYPANVVAGLVQRNTSSGWSGYGMGVDGQLAAYVGHGATPDRTVRDSRLLVVGSDVYLAVDVPLLSSSVNFDPFNPTFGIVLLKKTR